MQAAVLEVVVVAAGPLQQFKVQLDLFTTRLATCFEQHATKGVNHAAATGKHQPTVTAAYPIDHHGKGLVFLGAGHDRGAVHRAIRVHVAVADNDQVDTQLRQGATAFRELDVVADQQADAQPVPAGGGEAITGLEQATFGRPQVGLAVRQGQAVRGEQD
ncbi:hypothetical protein D3C72_1827060 [compost metagenome]